MFHSRWKGSHYEAGLRHGTILYKHGINPMGNIPISSQRKEFAAKCLPVYMEYYPEIVEEIQGMTDGLHDETTDIADFLLTMYCFVFDNKCSCFAFSSGGKTVFGRNSDFLVSIEKLCDSAYYKLDGAYSFIGNTTAWTEMEDGVNEHGLAVGLTFIYPTRIRPGMNAGMIVRYLLEKCRTTEEALAALQMLPISSQHTITLADKSGDIAVAECNCEGMAVRRPQGRNSFVFTTNHFVSEKMRGYQYDGADDVYSHERYETLTRAFEREREYSLDFARNLLSGKMGFLCQYDRKKGMDTVWSAVYDLTGNNIYRVEGNPSRKSFKTDDRMKQK